MKFIQSDNLIICGLCVQDLLTQNKLELKIAKIEKYKEIPEKRAILEKFYGIKLDRVIKRREK